MEYACSGYQFLTQKMDGFHLNHCHFLTDSLTERRATYGGALFGGAMQVVFEHGAYLFTLQYIQI